MPVGGNLEAELGCFAADCRADARADVNAHSAGCNLQVGYQRSLLDGYIMLQSFGAPEMAQGKMRLLWVQV